MHISNEKEMEEYARAYMRALVPNTHNATIIALYGDLGAGKTTFSRFCLRALGVEGAITSPTFVLQKEYALKGQAWEQALHIDAYRIETVSEMEALQWKKNSTDTRRIIFIEWADKVERILPDTAKKLVFVYKNEHEREIREQA